MNITSYFLGVRLKEDIFFNLFKALQNYLVKNNLENVVEVLNTSTPHITLYYFEKDLDAETRMKIQNDLEELNKNKFSIFINSLKFFEKDGQKILAYLHPTENKNLENINSKLKSSYKSEVPDNDYPIYIPHMTLFKIKNCTIFSEHEKAIESVINKELKKIKSIDAFEEFNLYEVKGNFVKICDARWQI